MKLTRTLPGFTLLILCFLCSAQNRDSRGEFDVATIHLVKLESREFPPTSLRRDPVRIAYSYVSLSELVMRAYDLPDYRMEWPKRLDDRKSLLYSIAATFPEGTTDAQLRGMLQRLLEDQLALRTHWVNRVLPSYELKTAPSGAKVSPHKFDPGVNPADPNDEALRKANRYTVFQGQSGWRITGVISIAQLVRLLGRELGRPMLDKTGLQGYYDIDFIWNRPNLGPPTLPGLPPATGEASIPEGPKSATLFPALEKQLGLKAEAMKLDADVLIIDAVEAMPKGN